MAAKELYDYLTTVVPDVDQTLSIDPQGDIIEDGNNTVSVHMGDDGSEERCVISATPVFYVSFKYTALLPADSGTVLDLYFDAAKANGMANSFKWAAKDGHTYVVRFAAPVSRKWLLRVPTGAAYDTVKLRILGRIAD